MVTVDRRLWLTTDQDELVEEGDRRAAFLWAGVGAEVSDAEAERLGYVPSTPAEPTEEPETEEVTVEPVQAPEAPEPEEKAVEAPAEDKAAPVPPNKARRARKSK